MINTLSLWHKMETHFLVETFLVACSLFYGQHQDPRTTTSVSNDITVTTRGTILLSLQILTQGVTAKATHRVFNRKRQRIYPYPHMAKNTPAVIAVFLRTLVSLR